MTETPNIDKGIPLAKDIKIEKGIPLPPTGVLAHYPFIERMEHGDSFLFPRGVSGQHTQTVRVAANKRWPEWEHIVRKVHEPREGHRMWRMKKQVD